MPDGRDLRVEDVREDLAPERAGRAAAGRPDLARGGDAGIDHQVQPVPQPERHALEDGPGEVRPLVADRQPDERAAGQRIRVGAALAGEVGEEQQAVAAGRRRPPPRRPAPRTPTPGASASRNQRRLPAADSITDIMCQRSGTAWQKAWTRPAGSTSGAFVAANVTPDVPSESVDDALVDRPGRRRAFAAWSPPPATTGVPARSPVAAAAAALIAPVTSGPSNVGGSQAGSIPSASRISGDQSRAARSNRIVPAPSALSIACSPVRRSRT